MSISFSVSGSRSSSSPISTGRGNSVTGGPSIRFGISSVETDEDEV